MWFMLSKVIVPTVVIAVETNVVMTEDVQLVNSIYMMGQWRRAWEQLKKTIEVVKK